MTKHEHLALRKFRTLTGPARKVAVREHLFDSHGVQFSEKTSPHTLSGAARSALADMAKVCGFRKPINCAYTLGIAFYLYLSRGER